MISNERGRPRADGSARSFCSALLIVPPAVKQNLDLGSLLQQVAPDDRPRIAATRGAAAGLTLALLAALTVIEFLADSPDPGQD